MNAFGGIPAKEIQGSLQASCAAPAGCALPMKLNT